MGTSDYQPCVNFDKTATVAASGTTSGAVDLSGCTLVGLRTPASLTSTSLSFTVSDTLTGTYTPLRDYVNNAISVTVDSTARQYVLEPVKFAGVRFLKIVAGSTEAAERVFTIVTRPV